MVAMIWFEGFRLSGPDKNLSVRLLSKPAALLLFVFAFFIFAPQVQAKNYVLVYDGEASKDGETIKEKSTVILSYQNQLKRLGLDYELVLVDELSDIANYKIPNAVEDKIVGFIVASHGACHETIYIPGKQFGIDRGELDVDEFSKAFISLVEKQADHLSENFFVHLNACTLAGACSKQEPGFLEKFAAQFLARFSDHEIAITGFNFSPNLAVVDNETGKWLSQELWSEKGGKLTSLGLKFYISVTNPRVYDLISKTPMLNKFFTWNSNLKLIRTLQATFYSGVGLWAAGYHKSAFVAPIAAFLIHRLLQIPLSGRGGLISSASYPKFQEVNHIERILSHALEVPTACKDGLQHIGLTKNSPPSKIE